MLTYELDERGNEPLYEDLYRRIRDDILAGTIGRDDPLPSKRALAKHLNISIMTVENAYAQLMTEGYIYSRPRSGFYAADVSDALRYRDETGGTGRERSFRGKLRRPGGRPVRVVDQVPVPRGGDDEI